MERLLVPAFRSLQRLLYRFGFELNKFYPAKGIPDAELYGPLFQPWRSRGWRSRLRVDDPDTLVTPDRKYILWQLASQTARSIPGDVFECGVYRGGTAVLLAQILQGSNKTLHLFDTFAGMPDTNAARDIVHQAGDFNDTSLASVRRRLAEYGDAVVFHPGFVPETFRGLEEAHISFAHIDLDIHDAIVAASAFVYPRMERGGIMLYDDYGSPTCPGARQAVDDFFAAKPEEVIALPTGQALVIHT